MLWDAGFDPGGTQNRERHITSVELLRVQFLRFSNMLLAASDSPPPPPPDEFQSPCLVRTHKDPSEGSEQFTG